VSDAIICNRPEEIEDKDVGTMCGLFEVKKIGDEYFSYFYIVRIQKHAPSF